MTTAARTSTADQPIELLSEEELEVTHAKKVRKPRTKIKRRFQKSNAPLQDRLVNNTPTMPAKAPPTSQSLSHIQPQCTNKCLRKKSGGSNLGAARKAIRGQIGRRLRSKKSKMRFDISNIEKDVFASLVGKNPLELKKKGAYFAMETILPKDLLPDVFDANLPENKRLWYDARDPETDYELCKTTNGYPRSLYMSKPCELRYKPSTKVLSVTAYSDEVYSWEDCCRGNSLRG